MKWIKLFEAFNQENKIDAANLAFIHFLLQESSPETMTMKWWDSVSVNSAKAIMDKYKSTGNWELLQKTIAFEIRKRLIRELFYPETFGQGYMPKPKVHLLPHWLVANEPTLEEMREEFLRSCDSTYWKQIKIDWWMKLFLKWNADEELIKFLLSDNLNLHYSFWRLSVVSSAGPGTTNFIPLRFLSYEKTRKWYENSIRKYGVSSPESLSKKGYELRKSFIMSMKTYGKQRNKKIIFPPNV